MRLPLQIKRETPPPNLQPFTDFFMGFDKVEAVRVVFGEETEAVLQKLKLAFVSNRQMYMGIRDDDGNITVGAYHLRHSDLRTLYLDVVHELFHIKQRTVDSEYFHREHVKFIGDWSLYFASPIEVPAYRHTVREAERIGMSYGEIVEYLTMGPAPPKVFSRFLTELELRRGPTLPPAVGAKLPVRIRRDPSIPLYPFTDHFGGFQRVQAVRDLFGDATETVLGNLRVEFVDMMSGSIFPSEEDGHLVVSAPYLRSGSVSSIYLDILLSMNVLKRISEGDKPSEANAQKFGDDRRFRESYKAMVEEARRMGVSEAMISKHLQLPRFMMTSADYTRFVRKLGLTQIPLER